MVEGYPFLHPRHDPCNDGIDVGKHVGRRNAYGFDAAVLQERVPNRVAFTPNFGRIFSALPARQMQFGIKALF